MTVARGLLSLTALLLLLPGGCSTVALLSIPDRALDRHGFFYACASGFVCALIGVALMIALKASKALSDFRRDRL